MTELREQFEHLDTSRVPNPVEVHLLITDLTTNRVLISLTGHTAGLWPVASLLGAVRQSVLDEAEAREAR